MTNKPLISLDEVRGFLGWPRATRPLLWLLFLLLGWHRLNRVYARFADRQGPEFARALLASRGIKLWYFASDLDRIPRSGGVVFAANHPLGAMDGLALLQTISSVRPDVRILGNALLERVEPLKPYLIGVVPFDGPYRSPLASGRGLLEAKAWVEQGGALIMFPAGEVSSWSVPRWGVHDRPWPSTSQRFLRELAAPVVPVDVRASLSWYFYLLGLLGPWVRTLMLPVEAVRPRWFFGINLRWGKPMKPEADQSAESFAAAVRQRRRQLRVVRPAKARRWKFTLFTLRRLEPVAEQGSSRQLRAELEALPPEALLTRHRDLVVYFARGTDVPAVVQELGRLREITFRGVGEGSGRPRDLDRFDAPYRHLILWNETEQAVWGAYRLGLGHELFAQGGIRAFYLSGFFRIAPEAAGFFAQSLEMGRAFIVPEAQLKPMPLYLLWKGIVHVLLRYPGTLRYVVGSVSVSNSYSRHSQAVMLGFLQQHFRDAYWARYIRPRKRFRLRLRAKDRDFIAQSEPADMQRFDRLIADIEPQNLRFPVLIKKYVGQNAKVIAFNRDPEFNTVDALMYMDVSDLPEDTLRPVLEELEAAQSQV
ncbi:MAG: lysophospholipid acyltransferase family protein [Cryomorphaceae bacterium]|jgi:putative hemolysin|nr:lysophospholipid acyltransferase family protein [Cryomorphaceae bacterium]